MNVQIITETMTPHHELRSVAVQCNLLAIPPLKKLGTISSEPDTESVPSDPDDDATDFRHIISYHTG